MSRADKLVLALAIIVVTGLYPLFWQGDTGEAREARLSLPGGGTRLLTLSEDGVYRIEGVLGQSVVEVAGGRVRFVSSPCNGKQCVHAGWLHKAGQFAACLPNGVSLFLSGGERFDSINF